MTSPRKEAAIRVTAMPADTNANGDIFGGWLMAQVDVHIKKRVKRNGRMEDMGEVVIQFGSLDELNGLIERLSPGATR